MAARGVRRRPRIVVALAAVGLAGLAASCSAGTPSAGPSGPAATPSTHEGSGAATTAVAPTVVAVGDIACDPADPGFNHGAGVVGQCKQAAVGRLVATYRPRAVLLLGDLQYQVGALSAFRSSFGPAFHLSSSVLRPAPGNHEYGTAGAAGYFSFFGARARPHGTSWYSFDVGTWHVVSLNSNCWAIGGCGPTSPEGRWLAADLAKHRSTRCTIAYWHHPVRTSGEYAGNRSQLSVAVPLWRAVASGGVDIVLNGHDHIYERFAPSPLGVRQFTVGTGGRSHYPIRTASAWSQFRDGREFGVLVLRLRSDGTYRWAFRTIAGALRDYGSGRCLNS